MVFVDELLKGSHIHGETSKLLYLFEFLVFFFGFGLLLLLVVLDELFLHEEVVFYSFQLQLSQSALGNGGD